MAPDIEYVNPAEAVEPGIRRGRAEFIVAVEKTLEGWETWEMKPERFEAVGDEVAVVLRYRARGRGSGVEVEGRESALWTVRDGKIVVAGFRVTGSGRTSGAATCECASSRRPALS